MKKTVVFNVRVEPAQHEFVKKLSKELDRSMGQIIRIMIEQFMESRQEKP